jgi:hypothetical protein
MKLQTTNTTSLADTSSIGPKSTGNIIRIDSITGNIETIKMLNIEEYAKAKGIPVESIPADVFKNAQEKSYALRKAENPKAEAFQKMCTSTQELLKSCASDSGVSNAYQFYRSMRLMNFLLMPWFTCFTL